MAYPTTIKLFLVSGQPDGLRTAEISNWSGLAIAGPRADLTSLKARTELKAPGIYFLVGEDADTGSRKVYIGEAENVSKRLGSKGHANKEFWISAIAFVAKDNNLTKGHVRYLEGKLIDLANELGITTENEQSTKSSLPESDQADMDGFLERVLQLLPVLGLTAFDTPEQIAEESIQWLYGETKGLKAKGRRTNSGFLVTVGSQAVRNNRPSATHSVIRRNKLIGEGFFIDNGDCYEFPRDYEFSSPSAAGSAICGGATNGLLFWRDKQGRKLKDIESG